MRRRRMEAAPLRRHRGLYKGAARPPWKDAFRQRCVERLKNSRARLLERYRKVGDNASSVEEKEALLVQEVMEVEWKAEAFAEALEDSELAVLEEIQRELIWQERQRAALEEYEQSLRFDEESLKAALQGLEEEPSVLCPICRRHSLGVTSRSVACPCGLHIATQEMTEDRLRSLLGEAMMEHNQHCRGSPEFAITSGMEGEATLLMSCKVCDSWAVVL
ncbi:RPA-interacting protein isoform X2 [Anolis carolinensis]|uniref:RPA-interacting protein isoform X2 n=1 Tax=Anolis carolinensis TaxID=28377 RepID=UPI002F2B7ECF